MMHISTPRLLKPALLFIGAFLYSNFSGAQGFSIMAGTNVTLATGTIFSSDSLVLTPSANFTMSNLVFSKTATTIHSTTNPYIARVYHFSNTSNPFPGSIQIYYRDGAELNGIAESALTLNIHNGTAWSAYAATTRNSVQNFVLTNGIAGVTLNELTLADVLRPLPLSWLLFTAVKHDQTALLHWNTAEQNAMTYTVQQSTDGIYWSNIGTVPALGNGNGNYSFVDANPATGINYYRILETDFNNRHSYSEIRTVNFSGTAPFTVLGNPVTGGTISIRVNAATEFSLYSADGKLLWLGKLNEGLQHIDVSLFPPGTYMLRTNTAGQKIIIQ